MLLHHSLLWNLSTSLHRSDSRVSKTKACHQNLALTFETGLMTPVLYLSSSFISVTSWGFPVFRIAVHNNAFYLLIDAQDSSIRVWYAVSLMLHHSPDEAMRLNSSIAFDIWYLHSKLCSMLIWQGLLSTLQEPWITYLVASHSCLIFEKATCTSCC